jgi:hypothetical protein
MIAKTIAAVKLVGFVVDGAELMTKLLTGELVR